MEADSWDLQRPNRLLRDHLDRLGIVFLDPTPAMRERAAHGERLYFRNDIHFNLSGNRFFGALGAALVAGVLEASDHRREDEAVGIRGGTVSGGPEPRR